MSNLAALGLRSFAYRPTGNEGVDPGLDIAALCQPFAGDRPAGESLLYEGTYDRIRAARSEEEANLPQGIWETAVRVGDWKGVRKLCVEALETQTKDIQVALWLSEALTRLYGFGGLAQGIFLLQQLCAGFWPSVHPELDDGDADARLNCFAWMNDSLSRTVARLPIASAPDAPPFSLADLDAAIKERRSDADLPQDGGKPIPTVAHIEVVLSQSPSPYLQTVYGGTLASLAALDALEETLAAVLSRDQQPSFGRLRQVLDSVLDKMRRTLEARGETPAVPLQADADSPATQESDAMIDDGEQALAPDTSETTPPDGAMGVSSVGGAIRSRADAFRALSEAADFLSRTEPHSPVPYLVKRAIRWGNMPLADLLDELLDDGGDRGRLMDLLGMGGGS